VTAADLLRLLAVPAFGWVALRDYRTRRVPRRAWYPLLAVGVVALALDVPAALDRPFGTRLFLLRVGFSLALAPLAYVFYRVGAFGAADAKAVATLAVLFPAYPTYELAGATLPLVASNVGVFSLTVLTDAVLVGALYPLAVGVRNALAGRISAAMFVALPVRREALLATHGRLMEDDSGFTLAGLDLDALRMYLRWRGIALSDLCADPETFRDPASLPADPNAPTDGAVDPGADPGRAPANGSGSDPVDGPGDGPADAPGDGPANATADERGDDPWGAAAFLASIDGSAYGTDPERLRAGLDRIAERDAVWVSPGLPFLVPLFVGLLVALAYGDVLFGLMRAAGVV
jgi:preflagellin peptidase FlaK